ncbi:MAG: histidine kinase [Flavobacteriales bacterium]|nr:histidine kinase [Flavobacteriales bacterium]
MKLVSTLVLCVLSVTAAAQFPLVRAVEVRTGQRRPAISRMAQDAQGLLWAATDEGLLRTDGDRVETMLAMEGDGITAMAPVQEGIIIATLDGALVHCTGERCDTLACDTTWRVHPITALAIDKHGVIWAATYGGGLLRIDRTERRSITHADGLPDDHVNDLDVLSDGRVVAATDQGLALFRDGRVEAVMSEREGAPDNLTLCVHASADGSVWAGTDRGGVFQWRLAEGPLAVLKFSTSWEMGPVRNVLAVGDMVWAGTDADGPIAVDLRLQQGAYRSRDAMGKAVKDLLVDHDGAVWWCDGTELLHRADPSILFVPEHEGLDLRRITALCTDAAGRIWFATAEGLFNHVAFFSEERTITRVPVPVDKRAGIISLAADNNGNVWAATFGNGVYKVQADGRVKHYTSADGLSNDNVLSVRSGERGIWFATLEGVSLYDADGFHRQPVQAGFVYDVAEAERIAYAATDGEGVWSWAEFGGGEHYGADSSFYTLVRDPQGRIWAAGSGTGFLPLLQPGLHPIAADRPPFDGELYAIGCSGGSLIAFGNTGVLAFDPKSGALRDVTAAFSLDGITAELNVVATDSSGALWFGCSKGLVRVRPTPAHFIGHIATALLSARLGNEVVRTDSTVSVDHDRNTLVVRFTGLHYADPGAVRFEYRLIGLDTTVNRTRDRELTFNALMPGDYIFGVRAYTGDGAGDAPWQEFRFSINLPWWRTAWAIAAGMVLLLLVAFVALRARERRIRYRDRMEQEKVRFQLDALRSQVDPHFLFNSFNALVELIESDPSIAVQHVEQLSIFFRNILQMRDRERISLQEEIALLENYVALEQRRFGNAIQVDIHVPDSLQHSGIVPLTLQLLVENALKHNTVVGRDVFIISVRATADHVEVSNPIRPRLTPPRSTGFGIQSITRRYAALTDRPVEVLREDGLFTVRIPLIEPEP